MKISMVSYESASVRPGLLQSVRGNLTLASAIDICKLIMLPI